jgi:hypothetical protein
MGHVRQAWQLASSSSEGLWWMVVCGVYAGVLDANEGCTICKRRACCELMVCLTPQSCVRAAAVQLVSGSGVQGCLPAHTLFGKTCI